MEHALALPVSVTLADALSPDKIFIRDDYRSAVHSVLIPYARVCEGVKALSETLNQDYAGKPVDVLAVMDGADYFCTDLLHEFNARGKGLVTRYDIRAKSYEGTASTGRVSVDGDLSRFKNRRVLVVEDIVDTGVTMTALTACLFEQGALDVRVASLLVKDTPRSNGYAPDYSVFRIPDEFVIGCGMDYNGKFRDLLHVCVISDDAIEKYR